MTEIFFEDPQSNENAVTLVITVIEVGSIPSLRRKSCVEKGFLTKTQFFMIGLAPSYEWERHPHHPPKDFFNWCICKKKHIIFQGLPIFETHPNHSFSLTCTYYVDILETIYQPDSPLPCSRFLCLLAVRGEIFVSRRWQVNMISWC